MSELVSFTEVDLLRQCPRRFFYERVMGRRGTETAEMMIGQCYHKALEMHMRRMLDAAKINTDPVPYAVTCDDAVTLVFAEKDRKGLPTHDLDRVWLAESIQRNIEPLIKLIHPVGIWPMMVPTGQMTLAPALELFFRDQELGYLGVIDLISANTPVTNDRGKIVGFVESLPCILDFKVKSGKRRKSQRDAVLSDQLATYALVLKETRAGFIEIPTDSREIATRIVHYEPQDLADWRKSIVDQAACRNVLRDKTDKAYYPMTARSNPLCSALYCPFFATDCYPMENQSANEGEVSQAKE